MTQEERDETTKELQRKMAQNLQFNYTTQEQAIKLLEIGVPKNSADGYYDSDGDLFVFNADRSAKEFFEKNPSCIPCWSVGRLEEIFDICDKDRFVLGEWPSHIANMYLHSLTQVEYFVTWATNCKQLLDFSKLGM